MNHLDGNAPLSGVDAGVFIDQKALAAYPVLLKCAEVPI
jgi:hypothetical protein